MNTEVTCILVRLRSAWRECHLVPSGTLDFIILATLTHSAPIQKCDALPFCAEGVVEDHTGYRMAIPVSVPNGVATETRCLLPSRTCQDTALL